MIKGIHHISLACCNAEELEKVLHFYRDTLGLPVARDWEMGTMLDTGSGYVEVFKMADSPLEKGVLRHFAFDVSDVDALLEKCAAAGYPVTMGPMDVRLADLNARVGFVLGPLGEEVELFQAC